MLAGVAFFARDVHAAGMTELVEDDTSVTFEGRFGI
jgi:hypothetical protein